MKILISGNKPEDVWNTNETGCFYRALPDKSLTEVKKGCRGGKKAKERLTFRSSLMLLVGGSHLL